MKNRHLNALNEISPHIPKVFTVQVLNLNIIDPASELHEIGIKGFILLILQWHVIFLFFSLLYGQNKVELFISANFAALVFIIN